jgi:hypothetical protein
VQWRLQWIALLSRVLVALGMASVLLALYVLASRLVPLALRPLDLLPWAGGAAGLWVIVRTWLRRVRLMEAAVRADEALGLKERLSTALQIREAKNEAEAAVLEDAAEHARGIRAGQAFPMRLGRPFGRAAFAMAALVLLYLYMPQFNLLARAAQKQNGPSPVAVEAKKEAVKQLEELAGQIGQADKVEAPQIAKKLEKDLGLLARQIKEQKLTGEQAVAKMEKIGEKITQRREEIEKMMEKAANMQTRGEGRNLSPIAKAMQKGDFAKAAKALEELKKQMQSGQMSEEQKKQLAQEMKQLAAQLGKESTLGQSLEQAADKMAQGQMNQALGEMDDAASQMQNMEAMLNELKALDGLDYDMDGRKKALTGKPMPCEECGKMCQGGLCESCAQKRGPWKPGDSRKQGGGMGGPGIGQGSIAEEGDGKTGFEKKRLKGDIQPGEIIARMKVPGRQPPGEIKTQFEELRVQSSQAAEDTIRGEKLPLEHKALVRQYFDSIKMDQAQGTPAAATPTGGQGAPAAPPAQK